MRIAKVIDGIGTDYVENSLIILPSVDSPNGMFNNCSYWKCKYNDDLLKLFFNDHSHMYVFKGNKIHRSSVKVIGNEELITLNTSTTNSEKVKEITKVPKRNEIVDEYGEELAIRLEADKETFYISSALRSTLHLKENDCIGFGFNSDDNTKYIFKEVEQNEGWPVQNGFFKSIADYRDLINFFESEELTVRNKVIRDKDNPDYVYYELTPLRRKRKKFKKDTETEKKESPVEITENDLAEPVIQAYHPDMSMNPVNEIKLEDNLIDRIKAFEEVPIDSGVKSYPRNGYRDYFNEAVNNLHDKMKKAKLDTSKIENKTADPGF